MVQTRLVDNHPTIATAPSATASEASGLPDSHSDLSIIIVNWNTKELLANCLQSIYATERELDFEVIVLDNGSTDGSQGMVAAQFPEVRLILSNENLGFAQGNNRALGYATGNSILLLNPDTVVSPSAISRLYAALQSNPHLGAVGAQLVYPDGSLQRSWGDFPSLRGEVPFLRVFTMSRPEFLHHANNGGSLISVDWAKGACLMIKRQALEAVGVLDEDYWLYTEEADWCYRARARGWDIAALTDVYVMHVEQAAAQQRLANSLVQYGRSRALFLEKHHSKTSAGLLWLVTAAKSAVWVAWPQKSPLGRSRNRIPADAARNAYKTLFYESIQQVKRLVMPG